MAAGRHRVVIVGGGFGGLQAARGLARADVDLTLIDRRNFHLFQPLTYQVATGALSPSEVAYPLRAILARQRNATVLLAEVAGFDLAGRSVRLKPVSGVPTMDAITYDTLIVAAGSRYSYFGHDEWRPFAPEVKSLESALAVRARILRAFEAAEMARETDRAAWLTFCVIGAGATGVEMEGQIAEIARDALRPDFRSIEPTRSRVLLIEAADKVLGSFPHSLSLKAARSLNRIGVELMLENTVVGISPDAIVVSDASGSIRQIAARTVVWAAGVAASPLAGLLAEQAGAQTDRAGRLLVESDLSLPGRPEVLVLGDMVQVRSADGTPLRLPGVAPVAMQQGRFAARRVREALSGRAPRSFTYRDRGNLATIGRGSAVADLHGIRLSGFVAWLAWLVVHLWYLIGFQNRLIVLLRWSFSFVTRGRSARLITGEPAD